VPTNRISIPGHTIEIKASLWSGGESVICDGREVSSKRSYFYVTPHSFRVQESGEEAVYEVNVLTGWMGFSHGYIVRRNGIIVTHKP
jgi:hypothetical protein